MQGLYDEIRIALHKIWKRRWLALLVAWGVCLLGWLFVSMMPNRYESEARVFVQMQSLLPDKIGISPLERQREVERVKRTLTSTVNLEKVVKGTTLGKDATSPKQVTAIAGGLKNSIKVVEEQENLFKISAVAAMGGKSDAENAKLSRDMVQSLIDIFVEDNLAGNRTETSQTLQFLDQQITAREKQLKEAEAARVAFEQKYMGVLPGPGGQASRRDAIRLELNQIESQLVIAQGALAAINGQMATTTPTLTGPSSYVGGAGQSAMIAAQMESQVAEAQSRGWTDSHPDMQSLQNRLARARSAAAREAGGRTVAGASMPNPAYAQLRTMQAERQATVSAMSGRRNQLNAEMIQQNASLADEPSLAAEKDRLDRDYQAVKVQYDKMLADREDVRLRGQMQTTTNAVKYRVVDPPSVPRAPSMPTRPMLLTGVLLMGLLIGAGVSFLMGQLQAGFSTAKHLAMASGMQVIGVISEVLTPKEKSAKGRTAKLFKYGAAALGGAYVLLIAVDVFQRSGVA